MDAFTPRAYCDVQQTTAWRTGAAAGLACARASDDLFSPIPVVVGSAAGSARYFPQEFGEFFDAAGGFGLRTGFGPRQQVCIGSQKLLRQSVTALIVSHTRFFQFHKRGLYGRAIWIGLRGENLNARGVSRKFLESSSILLPCFRSRQPLF